MSDNQPLPGHENDGAEAGEPTADTKKPKTHVLMVVDMSGSMSGLAADVRGGFNAYVDGLKADGGEYRLTVVLFDDRYVVLCADTPLTDVPRLTADNYRPRGWTALLDAVGRTIRTFETRVPTLGDDDRVMLVVQTDGAENKSVEFDWWQIAGLIRDREAGGKWTCVYLGQHADAWSQASRMGFNQGSTVVVGANSAGTAGSYTGLTYATTAYSRGADGATTSETLRTFVPTTDSNR